MAKHRDQPHAARTRARKRVLQALYQWLLTGDSAASICAQFEEEQDFAKVDGSYFRQLVTGVIQHQDVLQDSLAAHTDRPLEQVDPLERGLLLLAAYELQMRDDVPANVTINEAVVLAKDFGATGSHAFVNGVLDKLSRSLNSSSPTHL